MKKPNFKEELRFFTAGKPSKRGIRKFPNKETKRLVRVSINVFYGIGVHFYVDIAEEFNPIWTNEGWTQFYEDRKGEGFWTLNKFNTIKEAKKFVQKIFRQKFSTTTHQLVYGPTDSKKWCYKDGD